MIQQGWLYYIFVSSLFVPPSNLTLTDEKRHDATDNVIDFINRLIIHIPDYHFLTTRYYGFYANASKKTLDKVHALLGIKKNKDNSRKPKTKVLKNKLNKFKYRTHLIDSFNLRSNSM